MSSQIERLAADFVPKTGSQRALTGTPEVIGIPAAWIGRFMWFHNSGDAECFLNFGEADSITIDETTATTRAGSTPFALTLAETAPKAIVPAGQAISFRLDASWTFMAHKSAGTGLLRFGLGQGRFGAED